MHLDDEVIQRLLHGELARGELGIARAHLAGCSRCRERVEEAELEEKLLLEHLACLDHAPPAVRADEIIGRGRRAPAVYRWAAGILLALGAAGAVYAVPGSPVPRWVDRVVDWIDGSRGQSTPSSGASGGESAGAGIAVAPGERLTVVIETGPGAAVATVSLTDESHLSVRAVEGAASFTTDVDRLTVLSEEAGTRLEIELPRGAPWVEIRAGGRRVLLKEGERIATDAGRDADGRYVVPLRRE